VIHAREDYNRIQDPDGKIGEDEPVFLVRAQDSASVDCVVAWAHVAEKHGASLKIVELALKHADRMMQWQAEHGSKIADL